MNTNRSHACHWQKKHTQQQRHRQYKSNTSADSGKLQFWLWLWHEMQLAFLVCLCLDDDFQSGCCSSRILPIEKEFWKLFRSNELSSNAHNFSQFSISISISPSIVCFCRPVELNCNSISHHFSLNWSSDENRYLAQCESHSEKRHENCRENATKSMMIKDWKNKFCSKVVRSQSH